MKDNKNVFVNRRMHMKGSYLNNGLNARGTVQNSILELLEQYRNFLKTVEIKSSNNYFRTFDEIPQI